MPLKNEIPGIVAALAQIPGVEKVHRGWPEQMELLPCITVTEAGNTPVDFRDGREYVSELIYYIRIFAARAHETDETAAAVEEVLVGLGYTRELSWEEEGADLRQRVMRYKKFL